jgi:uncharacterized integral membrane protein (TIGR00698 family)
VRATHEGDRHGGKGAVLMTKGVGVSALWMKEDWWAVWLGLGIVACGIAFYLAGSTLGPIAVTPPRDWTAPLRVVTHFQDTWSWYLLLFVVFGVAFTISTAVMRYRVRQFLPGFALIYVVSVAILVVSQSRFFHTYSLEAPLVALVLGLLVGNVARLPRWLDASLRTEYYIKTGIVLLGATLPLTAIVTAGPIAFLQATIVSLSTWLVMFFVATRLFGMDRRFGAVLGAGGAVCGVSASIAVGGAVKADKEHVAISISIVSLWALVMIFFLPLASKLLALPPGVAGAWIGTSEFADAAGYAAAQTIASHTGTEAAIQTFTLMKVVGRDIWIGIWAFVLAIVSSTLWERTRDVPGRRVEAGVIWGRFPKFVIGFFVASVVVSFLVARATPDAATEITARLINPIKTLRTWTFVFTFLCIGLTTRFRELAKFGMPPFWAFTVGVAINVPLGYLLSTVVFRDFWTAVH